MKWDCQYVLIHFNSTLTDWKINLFYPEIPEGKHVDFSAFSLLERGEKLKNHRNF